ncbi:lipoyl(octanoyl) transferase LipB [Kordiimonas sp. SCSIO 12610]|uniref:lipoyl(octanoyl) transferase LipB n=1 Tax=Kordiimonas sp. SCSIO 12610 TaxID=2829597 RepID=UPI00210872CA|nr:lipoyl(octanoyl) transferase LipB [Kordiimonas sp. SCSIO 12610]UTW54285.1 lipoyl(octanoyl) transferase LipB [Kordiimonas sp. SCSIO 12610]
MSCAQKLPDDLTSVEWKISDELISYPDALEFMEERVRAIRTGEANELVWLLEHPPLYTAGTSAKPSDLVDPDRFPVYDAGRGGEYTYHGPGQRVVYFLLDLKKRGKDIRKFVYNLEEVIIQTLETFGVQSERKQGRVGVWVDRPDGSEEKIAAIGVRVRQWVTYHGIAINVEPDLEHFQGIVPCGISEHGVTSMTALGLPITMNDLDVALKTVFDEIFGLRPKEMLFNPASKQATRIPKKSIEETHPVFQI